MSTFRRLFARKKGVKDIEPQEVLLDGWAQEKEEQIGVSEKRMEVPLSKNYLLLFAFIMMFLFCILFGRSLHLQVIEGSNLSSLAERNRSAMVSVQTLRGVIYDRNMDQLVFNSSRFDLEYSSSDLPKKEDVERVAEVIYLKKDDIIETITDSSEESVVVKEDLEHSEVVSLLTVVDDMDGFSVSEQLDREYKDPETFSHVVGYMGKIDRETIADNPDEYSIRDYVGRAGVERSYEHILNRKKGEVRIERDSAGNIKNKEVVSLPEGGSNVVLSIDAKLQRKIEEEVLETLENVGSEKAAVVAVNPQTGNILSMTSVPSYDNHIFSKRADQSSFSEMFSNEKGSFVNRNISATYPSGSVIKPLVAAAALEEDVISPEKEIYSPGHLTVENPWSPSEPSVFRDFQAHGWTNVREAIAVSSNVYFYTVGGGYEDQEGLGIERMKNYFQEFGLGSRTGIDLQAEAEGFVPDMEWKREEIGIPWTVGDTYNTSIGQGYLSVTPLQIAMAYSSLVNGGKLLSPSILKKVVNDDGEVVERRSPQVLNEGFISQSNLNEVMEGMRQTTLIGTAKSLGTLPVEVGAKTGTAQIPKPGHYHNWITVFAPFDDPEIVITIVVEEVEGVRAASIPLARSILEWYFSEYNN